jgi:hypothetical protein
MVYAIGQMTRALQESQKLCLTDMRRAEYELEYSCLFVDYLIAIANFAIHFGLLNRKQAELFANEVKIHSINAEIVVHAASNKLLILRDSDLLP